MTEEMADGGPAVATRMATPSRRGGRLQESDSARRLRSGVLVRTCECNKRNGLSDCRCDRALAQARSRPPAAMLHSPVTLTRPSAGAPLASASAPPPSSLPAVPLPVAGVNPASLPPAGLPTPGANTAPLAQQQQHPPPCDVNDPHAQPCPAHYTDEYSAGEAQAAVGQPMAQEVPQMEPMYNSQPLQEQQQYQEQQQFQYVLPEQHQTQMQGQILAQGHEQMLAQGRGQMPVQMQDQMAMQEQMPVQMQGQMSTQIPGQTAMQMHGQLPMQNQSQIPPQVQMQTQMPQQPEGGAEVAAAMPNQPAAIPGAVPETYPHQHQHSHPHPHAAQPYSGYGGVCPAGQMGYGMPGTGHGIHMDHGYGHPHAHGHAGPGGVSGHYITVPHSGAVPADVATAHPLSPQALYMQQMQHQMQEQMQGQQHVHSVRQPAMRHGQMHAQLQQPQQQMQQPQQQMQQPQQQMQQLYQQFQQQPQMQYMHAPQPPYAVSQY